jgi:predicted kinase
VRGFQTALDERIAELRQKLAEARADEDDHLVDVLLQQLETLSDVADRSDVDTTQMEAVLAAETGTLPIIPDPQA